MQGLTVPLRKGGEKKKSAFIFSPQPSSDDILAVPFLPFAHFLSLLPPMRVPSLPHRPCWIGGVNTGRERALFHHTRAGAGRSCAAPVPGSKVYCGFHFTFPQPITEPR